ncbi:MAG: Kazal-type serine protease inhibitor domain-containing protein [Candidatus Woesearchaeota archaeon]|jgi:hypothetical protein|nr:Kazal-type serine protease inhibitor domain-containing protein [Candidatus Woesearchaeota archaeon]MDP7182164.1 Kazal-type serine protease inhibitor domain-containing protein [Candidatus Woesearchaeota archaeon]MDP7199300.1 Kazal-type serine protease inhibitor domain-containing protein [Candidatus Woesearchaeota archaeon]MDP7467964.1 Kazal-type serine protease inhibitor domain-containing protein [Candidatus Woesearchaeota archaeon]MDP7647589.1 Kazal-type serine protease inhibitor domain-cont
MKAALSLVFLLLASMVYAACPSGGSAVCGEDGRTYANACQAKSAGVDFAPVACGGNRDTRGRIVGAAVASTKSLSTLKRAAQSANENSIRRCVKAGTLCDAAVTKSKNAKKAYLAGYAAKAETVLGQLKVRVDKLTLGAAAKASFAQRVETLLVTVRANRKLAEDLPLTAPAEDVVAINKALADGVVELNAINLESQAAVATQAIAARVAKYEEVVGKIQAVVVLKKSFNESFQKTIDDINLKIQEMKAAQTSFPALILSQDPTLKKEAASVRSLVRGTGSKIKSLISRLNAAIKAHNRAIEKQKKAAQ